jgi:hypothetical protein
MVNAKQQERSMSDSARPAVPLNMQVVDISPAVVAVGPEGGLGSNDIVIRLLHEILQTQRQQLEASREMLQLAKENRQRQHAELEAWQRENQHVVERCREVLGTLSRVHSGMLSDVAEYIRENEETLLENEFSISEFVDRFGPRMHHLSAMLGVLKQVSAPGVTEQGNQGA